jgi:hypothetical protein
MAMDLTTCPECGHAAEVTWREVMESTDGPVEHAQIRCVQRHWFLLPVAHLSRATAPGRAECREPRRPRPDDAR